MPFTKSVLCDECDSEKGRLELRGYRVLGCAPAGNGVCVISYEEKVAVADGAATVKAATAGVSLLPTVAPRPVAEVSAVHASRTFFRRAAPGFRRVCGEPIARIQRTLQAKNLLAMGVDGQFGGDTEQALKRYQGAKNLAVTGTLNLETWRDIEKDSGPALFDRCLQLTADFEGHGFTLVQGNFDGAGLTWGIIGFTLEHEEIQALVAEADAIKPGFVDDAFGPQAAELRRMMKAPWAQALQWADSLSTSPRKSGVKEPWKAAFRAFGEIPQVQRLQIARAETKYWVKARKIAQACSLKSELGYALAFDIAVQNGGIEPDEADEIRRRTSVPLSSERQLRDIIADVIAQGSKPEWVENVWKRKRAIAHGGGPVHGSDYLLPDWGLDEVEAAP